MRLYAVIRADLGMSPGKVAAQTGHAYLNAYLACADRDPVRAAEYREGGKLGTKVALSAKDDQALERIYEGAVHRGLPAVRIVDSGHVIPGTEFNGKPVLTAVGVGPARRSESKKLLAKYKLIK